MNKSGSTCSVVTQDSGEIPNSWLQVQESFSSMSTQIEMKHNYPNNPHCVQHLNWELLWNTDSKL